MGRLPPSFEQVDRALDLNRSIYTFILLLIPSSHLWNQVILHFFQFYVLCVFGHDLKLELID